MTKTDAVNFVATSIGLRAVSALETGTASTIADIEREIDRRTKLICAENWQFNRRTNVVLGPTTLSTSTPLTIHLSDSPYQRSNPNVLSGLIQNMPHIRVGYTQADATRDPTMYPYAGQIAGDALIIASVADAIGAAKAAGRTSIVQIQKSGVKWLSFTDQVFDGGLGGPGELSAAGLLAAVHAGAFTTTTESGRIAGIVSGITARLDALWGGARPDGCFHDIENGPIYDAIIAYSGAVGAVALGLMAADGTPTVGMLARIAAKIAAGTPGGGKPGASIANQFAYDAVIRELIYNTIVTEWAGFGASCKHYMWDTANSTNNGHAYLYNGTATVYPSNVAASHFAYMGNNQTDDDSLTNDLADRVTTQPFAVHLALPYGAPFATIAQTSAMLATCREAGIADVFLFAPSELSDDLAGDADAAAKLDSLHSAITSATAPVTSTEASSLPGNILLSNIVGMDPNSLSILEIYSDAGDVWRNITMTSDRLFDLDNNTDVFSGSLTVRYVMEVSFASLPTKVQDYVAAISAATFNRSYGQPARQPGLDMEAVKAKTRARNSDCKTPRSNVLGIQSAQDMTGRRVPFPGGPLTADAQRRF